MARYHLFWQDTQTQTEGENEKQREKEEGQKGQKEGWQRLERKTKSGKAVENPQ